MFKKIFRIGITLSFAGTFFFFLSALESPNRVLKAVPFLPEKVLPEIVPRSSLEGDYLVKNVIDGDTIVISANLQNEKVRLIGIDTPEILDPRRSLECYGEEASNRAKELLVGKKIRMEIDTTQGVRDKYGRLLGYVYLEDGTFFNRYMLEAGYAREYTYSAPYRFQEEFRSAEKRAQREGRGLWGFCKK